MWDQPAATDIDAHLVVPAGDLVCREQLFQEAAVELVPAIEVGLELIDPLYGGYLPVKQLLAGFQLDVDAPCCLGPRDAQLRPFIWLTRFRTWWPRRHARPPFGAVGARPLGCLGMARGAQVADLPSRSCSFPVTVHVPPGVAIEYVDAVLVHG